MAEEGTESALPFGELTFVTTSARKRNRSRMSNMVLRTKSLLPHLKFWHVLHRKVKN